MHVYVHSSILTFSYQEISQSRLTQLDSSFSNLIDIIANRNHYNLHFSRDEVYTLMDDSEGMHSRVNEVTELLGQADTARDILDYIYSLFKRDGEFIEELLPNDINNIDSQSASFASAWPVEARKAFYHVLSGIAQQANEDMTPILADYEGNAEELYIEELGTSFEVSNNYEDIGHSVCAEALWGEAEHSVDLKTAIYLKAKAMNPNVEMSSFYIGSEFMNSLVGLNVSGGAILNKCARVISGEEEASYFRQSRVRTSPPRVRAEDGAKGYRMHITLAHEGYRLMYWKSDTDSVVEFSNVGAKHELAIKSGVVAERV